MSGWLEQEQASFISGHGRRCYRVLVQRKRRGSPKSRCLDNTRSRNLHGNFSADAARRAVRGTSITFESSREVRE